MKQQNAPVQHHNFPANLHHTLPLHAGGERKQKRAGVSNFTMSDCYEKLKQLVPTIPKNKKISRVEILQHVIDYIQDLQTALEERNIDVKMMGNLHELSGMMQDTMAMPAPAAADRRPFTTIVPQQQQRHHHQAMSCPPPAPLGEHTQSNTRHQPCYPSQQTSLFHSQGQGFNEFHSRQQMNMNTTNMASMSQQHQQQPHPVHKLQVHPYETPESSPESRPCSC